MRKRRENEAFRAAERIKTKLRMRRLCAALRKAKREGARRVKSGSNNRRSSSRRPEYQAAP
jgi:hypothetical protein